ncbi:peptidyl-prolyl cis-trans isomerase, EpsD family [Rhodoferax lacus]|uniref:Peptidyl-prolyl cis-trans isomerase, EpsD family n=1 Tax=Rhodoferax lacus TaxID=2184758 RepID=A0A3E1RF41_9BURK|nr:EpsD family peptidyl-prolyl cis-trans isomerase [Rhodoferax lacus]RFO97989.1 peptidyl-prolyl cis-trans isomerase, EpsD family [Rhodoferax lacus]
MYALSVSPRFVLGLCVVGAAALLAAGCGNKDPMAAQVVATVDGADINLRQLNEMLAKTPDITPENISHAKTEILGTLVEQQLAVNLAITNKLDRKPEVANAIEASRREILARAAMDQLAADLAPVGEEEAKRYYAEHPALYAERRIFTLQEIVLKKSTPGMDKLRAQVGTAKRMEEVAAWLKDKKVDFQTTEGTRAAEQIPMEVLTKLQRFKDGQMGLIEGRDAYTVVRLVSSIAQPIAASKILPAITAFLSNQHAAATIKQAKLDMKKNAKLEYFGEFVGGEAAFKAGRKALVQSEADEEAQINARAKAEATIVEQGIKGL